MDDSDSKSFKVSQQRLHTVLQLLVGFLIFIVGVFAGKIRYETTAASPDVTDTIRSSIQGNNVNIRVQPPPKMNNLIMTPLPQSLPPPHSNSNAIQFDANTHTPVAAADDLLRFRLSTAFEALETRGQLPQYLNSLGLVGEGVEVGVRDGDFSKWILKNWKGRKIHCVDPWKQQDKELYLDVSNRDQDHQDSLYNNLKVFMESEYPTRHEIHRGYSVQVAEEFADSSLDFIYLDARHDYDGLREDIIAWWPKLKLGGVFAGHDFVPDRIVKEGAFGVQKAVLEFANREKRIFLSISSKDNNGGRSEPQKLDGGWTTWYLIK